MYRLLASISDSEKISPERVVMCRIQAYWSSFFASNIIVVLVSTHFGNDEEKPLNRNVRIKRRTIKLLWLV